MSISRPSRQGKVGPSGAVSMNPAAAETSTSRTMPNFDSSAYAPIRAKTAMLPPPRSTVATLGKARLGAPASAARRGAVRRLTAPDLAAVHTTVPHRA